MLTAVDVATGEKSPDHGSRARRRWGDFLPSVSPDGRRLAFVRNRGARTGELQVLSMSEEFAPSASLAAWDPTGSSGTV